MSFLIDEAYFDLQHGGS